MPFHQPVLIRKTNIWVDYEGALYENLTKLCLSSKGSVRLSLGCYNGHVVMGTVMSFLESNSHPLQLFRYQDVLFFTYIEYIHM